MFAAKLFTEMFIFGFMLKCQMSFGKLHVAGKKLKHYSTSKAFCCYFYSLYGPAVNHSSEASEQGD
jgi:hypothetical protein